MKIFAIFAVALIPSFANAYDVSGVRLGDNFDAVKEKMPAEIETKPHFKGGEYGFNEHSSYIDGLAYQISTRPDNSIYRVIYYQDFPVKQAESIKASLCQKYEITQKSCFWSKKYEDVPPNMNEILFSQGQRLQNEIVSISIEKARQGRKFKDGYIGVSITLEVNRSTKEVDRWVAMIKEQNDRAKIQSSLRESKNAPKNEAKF